MPERSEAKSAKRSFASKINIRDILTRSSTSRFSLRDAQPFLAKFKGAINWPLYPLGLTPAMKMTNKVVLFTFGHKFVTIAAIVRKKASYLMRLASIPSYASQYISRAVLSDLLV